MYTMNLLIMKALSVWSIHTCVIDVHHVLTYDKHLVCGIYICVYTCVIDVNHELTYNEST